MSRSTAHLLEGGKRKSKKGSKKGSNWGVRYRKKTEEAWNLIREIIQPRIKDEYLSKKILAMEMVF